jgi:hypothetical protein
MSQLFYFFYPSCLSFPPTPSSCTVFVTIISAMYTCLLGRNLVKSVYRNYFFIFVISSYTGFLSTFIWFFTWSLLSFLTHYLVWKYFQLSYCTRCTVEFLFSFRS